MTTLDLAHLGLDRGGHLLLERALAPLEPGARLEVRAEAPEAGVHLRAWCREKGHGFRPATAFGPRRPATAFGPRRPATAFGPRRPATAFGPRRPATAQGSGVRNGGATTEFRTPEPWAGSPIVGWVTRGTAVDARRRDALPSAGPDGEVVDRPPGTWGLAARGALVEAGGPAFHFPLDDRRVVWADSAAGIYRQAVAAQWDPATAVDWDAPVDLPADVEAAVVTVMTYLVENENAALVVPARFLAQVHPHFREVVGVLAVQVADEARHVEVFTRRARLRGGPLGLSTAGGQASLQTLVEEPDFAVAHFLLSVLGEGTFLSLLSFLERNAPEPVTRQVTRLALADEARHVAFGMAHLEHVVGADPGLRGRLAAAVRSRHDALAHTAGLNTEVFDALVLLAAGSWEPQAVAAGFAAVQALEAEMADGRRRRLVRLGFTPTEAEELSALHTRNFM